MATQIGSINTGNRTHIQGAHTGAIGMAGAHTGAIGMAGAHTGAIGMAGAHTGAIGMAGAHMGRLPDTYLGGAKFLSPSFGTMSPVGLMGVGNVEINTPSMGGWDSWGNAGYFNPSFDYGFPTNMAGVGMGAIGLAGTQISGAHRPMKRKPRQLMDVFRGRDKRNLRGRTAIKGMDLYQVYG
jgi:hypothetical protein